MENKINILKKYAEQLGYPFIVPVCDQPELSEYFVCWTEAMKNCPNGKFGTPCVITLNDKGEPYRLTREELVDLFHRIKDF